MKMDARWAEEGRRCRAPSISASSSLSRRPPGRPFGFIDLPTILSMPLQVIPDLIGVPYEDQPAIQQSVEAVAACLLTVLPTGHRWIRCTRYSPTSGT